MHYGSRQINLKDSKPKCRLVVGDSLATRKLWREPSMMICGGSFWPPMTEARTVLGRLRSILESATDGRARSWASGDEPVKRSVSVTGLGQPAASHWRSRPTSKRR